MQKDRCKVIIAGASGDGATNTVGNILTNVLSRLGLLAFQTIPDYRSVIRSPDHISLTFCVGSTPWISAGDEQYDIFVALEEDSHPDTTKKPNRWGPAPNRGSLVNLGAKIKAGGIVLYDSSKNTLPDATLSYYDFAAGTIRERDCRKDAVCVFGIPMTAVAKEIGLAKTRNMIAIGALVALLRLPEAIEKIEEALRVQFEKKKDAKTVVAKNMEAVSKGFMLAHNLLAERHYSASFVFFASDTKQNAHLVLSGNQAVALGALAGGVRFATSYPITPATQLGETLKMLLPRFGGIAIQASSEIAAIHMAIGASAAGVRVITATSGPGLSLKIEGIGHAAMMETPICIVVAQRKGPDTGAPTKTEQADFDLVRAGSHGDIPKIILAPTNQEECFWMTIEGLNLADKYRCPVFLLTDLVLAEGKGPMPFPDLSKITIDRGSLLRGADIAKLTAPFLSYQNTPSGISPRIVIGETEAIQRMLGTTHDEAGRITTTAEGIAGASAKLMKKMAVYLQEDFQPPQIYGSLAASSRILTTWGTTRNAALEAKERFEKTWGQPMALVHFTHLWPLDRRKIKTIYGDTARKEIIVIEGNYTGQFANILEWTLLREVRRLNFFHGRAIQPQEIYSFISRTSFSQEER